jgi:hypothetical protein
LRAPRSGNLSLEHGDAREEDAMTYREEQHMHEPPTVREESNGVVGYAAIKYTAIVVIVLAILAFLAWYVLPRIT